MKKVKSAIILAVIVLFTAILGVADFCNTFPLPKFIENGIKDFNSIGSTIGLGIDLKGGYVGVLTPKLDEGQENADIDELFESAVDILQARLENKGYTEATITIQGIGASREIRVEIPEVDNAEEVLEVIGSAGKLTFEDSSGTVYLEGADIADCQAGYDQDGEPIVQLKFTQQGTKKFSEATAALTSKQLYIKLDGEVVSAPTVNEQITSESAQITGIATPEEASNIAAIIKGGRLELEFELASSNKISATLGENALPASVIAGAIGLVIVFIIMILNYRGLGVASSIALSIYTVLLVVLLALIPWVQLTLPGIAGVILSIGMAVDANVIIFERIKEEYANGKTVTSAINVGFKRAFITIFDSNITTVLAAIVLWILCPGSIKGFAITLLVGILLSMFTAIVITRFIVKLLFNISEGKPSFFALKREVLEDEEA
ncbi:MAG: protein translocase subunit SecD [Clostridia bacterium]|nr:protein translocase subunit SecD [Clostridia bacterium]